MAARILIGETIVLMTYWQLFYHLVWPTRNHRALLPPQVAGQVHSQLRTRATRMGSTVYAVGGTDNHVHVVAAVPPRWSISLFVGQLKSQVTQQIKRTTLSSEPFAWHDSYGALSFGRQQLSSVIAYVQRQPELHAAGNLIRVLELVDGDAPAVGHLEHRHFYIDSEEWRNELLALDAEVFAAAGTALTTKPTT